MAISGYLLFSEVPKEKNFQINNAAMGLLEQKESEKAILVSMRLNGTTSKEIAKQESKIDAIADEISSVTNPERGRRRTAYLILAITALTIGCLEVKRRREDR
jgi:hypothetical protein